MCFVQENDEGDTPKILYKDAAYYGAFVRSVESCAARYIIMYIHMYTLTLTSKIFKIAFNNKIEYFLFFFKTFDCYIFATRYCRPSIFQTILLD